MKLSKKKVFALALAVCLIATLSMGSLAWFTDSDKVTNDFFVAGSENQNPDEVFSIDVWEDNEKDDPLDDEKWNEIVFTAIQPGDNFYKEVHVENTGAYDQYVRVTVTVTGASVWQDVFGMYLVPLEALVTNLDTTGLYNDRVVCWYDGAKDALVYEFFYEETWAPDKELVLFETVQIPTSLDRFQAAELGGKFEIDVVADAVQTNNVGNNVFEAFKTVGLMNYTLATPDTIDEVLANAKAGEVVYLGAGTYESITIPQNGMTLFSNEAAVVGYVNLNAKDDVVLQSLTFDAAYAKPGYRMTSTSGKNEPTGLVASIVGAENSPLAADRPVIANCTFTGTAPDNYAPIHFAERNRKTEMTKEMTVTSCTFETNASYYIYCHYLQKPGALTFTNNIFGNDQTTVNYAIYAGSTRCELLIDGNTFNNWHKQGAAVFASNGDGKGHTVTITNNHFDNRLIEDNAVTAIQANNYINYTSGAVIFEGNTVADDQVLTALETDAKQASVMINKK